MTPLQIHLMLHAYCRSDPLNAFPKGMRSTKVMSDAFEMLVREGLISKMRDRHGRPIHGHAQCAGKGRAYVDHLCRVSLPVERFECRIEPAYNEGGVQ